ncbi:type II secretion system protein [Pseudoalteromonas sp. MMG010]|uniref:type II secretion system protein n=1 Tax=Pseudoalteromonas sp. MMG010 TaxID=2822685 RepID=UPI001B3A395A|nr:type II secretion system protein [Pseudoalteromonas sp. MMG010]MBQ4832657.1 type II secretion system protein [Pseudoalteromonas sp. MMG010]
MKSSIKQRLGGFTLVELIITLVILGVLSITVAPKFLGSSTEDAYAYRDRTLSALRTMQLRAMQNTATSACHTLYISDDLIAPPAPDSCVGGGSTNNADFLVIQIDQQRSDVRFNTQDSNGLEFTNLSFDPLGRVNQSCSNECRIDFTLAAVCITGEGLIYACQ